MSSTATSTAKSKKPRMSLKQRVRYWTARAKTEKRQLEMLERRKTALEKQIQKQQSVVTWADNWRDSSVMDLENAEQDQDSPYYKPNPDQEY